MSRALRLLVAAAVASPVVSFSLSRTLRGGPVAAPAVPLNLAKLPGDPTLVLSTTVDLGERKLDIMKGLSKAISEVTGKPESYIAVSLDDKKSMIWAGEETACALGIFYSIGGVAQDSNGALTSKVTDLLSDFGVAEDRVYIQVRSDPRAEEERRPAAKAQVVRSERGRLDMRSMVWI